MHCPAVSSRTLPAVSTSQALFICVHMPDISHLCPNPRHCPPVSIPGIAKLCPYPRHCPAVSTSWLCTLHVHSNDTVNDTVHVCMYTLMTLCMIQCTCHSIDTVYGVHVTLMIMYTVYMSL